MKKLILFIALFTAITAIASAQAEQPYSYITKVLAGEWKWTAYSGGAQQLPSREATDNYKFTLHRDETAPGLFYNCTVFKNDVYLYSTRMQITENPSNHNFPYTLHHDITAPLMNGAALPAINFRIAEMNILEFSNGNAVDYRYVFKNIGSADGC